MGTREVGRWFACYTCLQISSLRLWRVVGAFLFCLYALQEKADAEHGLLIKNVKPALIKYRGTGPKVMTWDPEIAAFIF